MARAAADLEAKLSAQRHAVKEYFPVRAVRWQDRCLVAFELERDPHFGAIGFDLPLSSCMSSSTTSATRKSLNVLPALSTAALAAFSQDSVLVPTNVMIL
jgi:hypothetical protein